MATQQEVIKAFMKSLDETNASGVTALNNAVKACSSFSGIQDVIDKLISDCKSATSVESFLQDKCGIILSNSDTGAITGADAGGSKVKTAESIVDESGKATYPSSTSFTKRGLTVIVPSKDTLTADEQTVVQGLYSWWIDGALKLAEESYGYSFTDSDATVKTITLKFEDKSSSTLAYVTPTVSGSKAKSMTLTVNMHRFKNLSTDDVNGAGSVGNFYLDRVLAHEMTHAIMAAKIDNIFNLPDFILEGTAELTHGIDDLRSADIKKLAGDSSQLENHLNVNGINSATNLDFSSGYIFLRYLAKQSSSIANSTADGSTSDKNSTSTTGGATSGGATSTGSNSAVKSTNSLLANLLAKIHGKNSNSTSGTSTSGNSTSAAKSTNSLLENLLAKIRGKSSSKALTVTNPTENKISIFSDANDLSQITNVFSDSDVSSKDFAVNIDTEKIFLDRTFTGSSTKLNNFRKAAQ